ncbi:MAG: carboxylating nicotinate-nucleotide diphosphorylase [Streptococcaceae bacterium]|nr:carboxylating nicotinate-nucleotide diphosphorylase [Streptococcaceae bacterium]
MNDLLAKEKIKKFLFEDIGTEDLTVSSIFSENTQGSGEFIAKSDGIICGLKIPAMVYELLKDADFTPLVVEGQQVYKGDIIGRAKGKIQTLLTGERVALNLMQRMSGIATKTAKAIAKLDDPTIQVCDTRKTMPYLRLFDKYAVKVGGGKNHRFGLYDGIVLKDNHLSYAGSLKEAVKKVRRIQGHMIKIEVEVETKEQLLEAVKANVDIIMFDNRTPAEIKEWRKIVPKSILLEASGGITIKTIHQFRGCGVDFISMGELTHSVDAFDLSFLDPLNKKDFRRKQNA